jgi:branched-chain amino acid transport system substrate-binding protein
MSDHRPIPVGILYSQTGVTSQIESSQRLGTLLAIEEINQHGGINGREIVPVIYDPQSTPMVYRALAERLVSTDGVKVIFGCYMSSTRKAVIPVVERRNCILFYATPYEGFEFSNNLIYTGAAPNQSSVQLADYMMSNFGARVYVVGSDYIYPYESNRIMTDLVSQRQGGEILGTTYVPLNASEKDFEPIIADIKAKRPDFIFSTVVGNATQHLYQLYAQAGLDPKSMPIGSLTTSEVEIAQMGAEIAAGHFTSSPYFQSLNSVANQSCLKRFQERFTREVVPNACWEAAYFQVHLFANAMRQSGSDDIDALMPYLLGSEYDAPQGRVRIEPTNHHTCLYPRIGRANGNGQFTVVSQSMRPVTPDPYLVNHAKGDWTTSIDMLVAQ